MASVTILDLEVEVLANILEFVDDESPLTTAFIAQVCTHFNVAVQLIRYRRLTISWSQQQQSWVSKSGLPQGKWETPELLRGLRHLTVHKGDLPLLVNDSSDDENRDEDDEDETQLPSETIDLVPLQQLTSVLRDASNIKTLTWKVDYLPPHEITESLQAHQPRAKLNIFRAKRLAELVGLLPSEKALAASPCLNTFSMLASDETCIEDHMAFQVIVALAPNLKFASLVSLPLMRSSDAELSGRWRAKPELWFPESKEQRRPNSSIRHLTLDGWCMSAETLEFWSRYIDLGSLDSFKCSRGSVYTSYFQRAPQLLKNLKHVSLNLNPHERNEHTSAAIEQYIATCSALSSLSLWSWRGGVALPTILAQHGSTLTELHLHEREDDWMNLRNVLSLEELQSIRISCPNLKVLTFDLNRFSRQLKVEDYEEIMNELSKFNLDILQIYLDCGLPWLAQSQSRHMDCNDPDFHIEQINIPLGGWCIGDDQFSNAITVGTLDARIPYTITPENKVNVYPPSTNKEICRFLLFAWKSIFGTRATGPRHLDMKFGEWERKHAPMLPGMRGRRDVRVWCRARPHEKDDKQDWCVVEIECCAGDHKRKFESR